MNALLKRQLRKHLQNQGVDYKEDLDVFLNAVSSSYTNYEEQLAMVQRAMALSSDELYEANESLRKETNQQKEIIKSLTNTIAQLYKHSNPEDSNQKIEETNLDALELARVIDNQTREIIESNRQRDILLAQLEKQN
ncbi:MAG TPA: two-component sensor histidine kinase, partial [Leeuwenhoekiella sp.]|nr:two-component sensor histidine kinase [Leeuwenhoekiella sp.]